MTEEKTKKEPLFVRGNYQEPTAEIGTRLTRRRFEIEVKYEALDQKKKKWETYTRHVSRYSLMEGKFEEARQIASFEGRKNTKLLEVTLRGIII